MRIEEFDALSVATSKSVAGLGRRIAYMFVQVSIELQYIGKAVSFRHLACLKRRSVPCYLSHSRVIGYVNPTRWTQNVKPYSVIENRSARDQRP